MATIKAIKAYRIDSPMNCEISWFRFTPRTFRMPISCALRAERAVERFMKLTQAISSTKPANVENM